MQKIGAIYIRVSTDKQEELSPDAQKRLLLEYAKSHDIYVPLDYIFQDNGISGRTADKRPEFQRMIGLAKAKDHPIDYIIVWKFSRFARNQEESILYKSLLKKNNVDVISISENTTGEFGTLIERIIEWMDEYYSIRLSGEVFRGMTESAMRGNYMSAPPIGYSSVGNGNPPELDENTKIIPLTMKKLHYEGKSSRHIAVFCNNKGWRTKRGNLFEPRDVDYILMNPFYAGKLRWNYTDRGRKLKPSDEVIYADGNWTALWTWEETQEMTTNILSRKKKDGVTKTPRDISSCKHWLSGVLRCSTCGKTLSYGGSKTARGFQCWNYAKGKCTTSHYVSEKNITEYVLDGLKNFISADYIPYEIVRASDSTTSIEINDLLKQLSRIEQREKRAKVAYLDGIDSKEEYKDNKTYCEKERERIKNKIEELKSSSVIENKELLDVQMINNIKDVITILENPQADFEIKGNAIRSIVDSIIFNRSDCRLDFTFRLNI